VLEMIVPMEVEQHSYFAASSGYALHLV